MALRFLNSGYFAGSVGIGTDSPLKKLSVSGGDIAVNNGNGFIVGAATTGNTEIGRLSASSGQLQILTESTRDIKFGSTTYGNIMFLEGTNGNVGIGTTSPSEVLHLSGIGEKYIKIVSTDQAAGIKISSDGTGEWKVYQRNSFDGLEFEYGGTSAMTFLSNKNVGIGTISPSNKLHVNSGTANEVAKFESTDGAAYLSIMDSNTTYSLQGIGSIADELTLYSNNAERVRIDSLGNVGIGTNSPSYKLDVVGTFRANNFGSIQGVDTGNPSAVNDEVRISGYGIMGNRGSLYFTNRLAAGTLQFGIGGVHGSGTKMLINSDGYVGIGITGPQEKLHIIGSTLLSNNNSYKIERIDGTNIPVVKLSSSNVVEFGAATSTSGATMFDFKTSGDASRMVILGSGNVGIGTTSPEAKLDVESEILISGTDPILRMERGDGFNSDILKVESSTDNLIIGDTSLDEIIFEADNGEAMRISSNLNVLIGTTTPTNAKLVIDHDNTKMLELKRNGNTKARFIADSNHGQLDLYNSTTTNTIRILSSGNSYFNGGNVGIGTTSPSSKLQVQGGIQMADDGDTASADKVGTQRYRADSNNSYVDMCMQTGATTYEWVNIVQNNW